MCGIFYLQMVFPKLISKKSSRDFLGGPVVKNLPSNAGYVGLIHGRGTKIPPASGQLSSHASTREPMCHKLQSPCALGPMCHN